MGQEKQLKVAVGLSGGVDSALSAYLLKKQGYEVVGVHIVCWDEGPHCRAREDRQDALTVAMHLEIPFKVLDFQKEYKERVIDRFYADYEKGLTPNPDVWCNSEIKFGMFLEWAMKEGFDFVATGHYAKVEKDEAGEVKLMVPKDEHKDQTYFLYRLGQRELSRVLFPLGVYLKRDVRGMAVKAGLPVANKPDSQGICFIGQVDVREFLKRRLKEETGEVVDVKGRMVGEHKGVWFYTIGQRGGWEIDGDYQKQFGGAAPILYVVGKDVAKNQLVVGFGAETYREGFAVGEVNWIHEGQTMEGRLQVRIRHGGKLLPAVVQHQGKDLVVELKDPERGIAPGQAAVFYREGECLGGGVIL